MNRLIIDPLHQLNPISRDFLGHFVVQVPGNIPQGIYHPSHPYSDEDGFRTDLLEVMREVHVSQLRWAGWCRSAQSETFSSQRCMANDGR